MLNRQGHAIVEFALSVPALFLVLLFPVQVLRLAAAQLTLECRASEFVRSLAARPDGAADLQASAAAWAARLPSPASAIVTVRAAAVLPAPVGRLPRVVEVVELDLVQDAPMVAFARTPPLRAHAREARWRP